MSSNIVCSDGSLLATALRGGIRTGLVRRLAVATLDGFGEGDSVRHATHGVLALEALELNWSVLVKEFIDAEVATANLDLNLVTDANDADALRAELVDTVALAHEHNLQPLAIRVVVDVLSQFLVGDVVLDRNVNSDARLKINDVLAQLLNLRVGGT